MLWDLIAHIKHFLSITFKRMSQTLLSRIVALSSLCTGIGGCGVEGLESKGRKWFEPNRLRNPLSLRLNARSKLADLTGIKLKYKLSNCPHSAHNHFLTCYLFQVFLGNKIVISGASILLVAPCVFVTSSLSECHLPAALQAEVIWRRNSGMPRPWPCGLFPHR